MFVSLLRCTRLFVTEILSRVVAACVARNYEISKQLEEDRTIIKLSLIWLMTKYLRHVVEQSNNRGRARCLSVDDQIKFNKLAGTRFGRNSYLGLNASSRCPESDVLEQRQLRRGMHKSLECSPEHQVARLTSPKTPDNAAFAVNFFMEIVTETSKKGSRAKLNSNYRF
jgi:hypothetical protein